MIAVAPERRRSLTARRSTIVALVAFTAALLLSSPAHGGYRVTDLGTLGGNRSQAFAINDRGQVVGKAQTSTGWWNAYLYENGQMRNLVPSSSWSEARDINAVGQVVGYHTVGAQQTAFLYDGIGVLSLGTLGGNWSSASGINDSGRIVGRSANAAGRGIGGLLNQRNPIGTRRFELMGEGYSR